MSRLKASRDAIIAALQAGGLTVATTGQFAAPCVLVEPGEPWAAVDLSLGRKRTGRWKLTLVAGRVDTEGNQEKLMDLIDSADTALLALPGVELPTWGRPFDASLHGVVYAGTMATIQYITQEA